MYINSYEKFQAGEEKHQAAGVLIEEWTRSAPMLPVRQDDLRKYPHSLLAYSVDETLLGHIAITSCEGGLAIVGGLIVNPNVRGHHIGLTLTKYFLSTVKAEIPETREFKAFANLKGSSLFYKAGGTTIGIREPLASNGCNWLVSLTKAAEVPSTIQSAQ
jgi:N-acetylglutamate synthase-like GNAT family acetyltransferase